MSEGYIVIPDLHGMKDLLDLVLKTYPERKLLFLGDLIDRGPDSRGVIGAVKKLVEEGRARLILGNHEYMAVEAVRRMAVQDRDMAKILFRLSNHQFEKEGMLRCWLENGGAQVIEEYAPQSEAFFSAQAGLRDLVGDLDWIAKNAEAWIVEDGGLFTHAGRLPPRLVEMYQGVKDKSASSLEIIHNEEVRQILLADQPHLWSRPYVDKLYSLPESIDYSVHGHTPQANRKPLIILDDQGKPAHYIDLGAVFHEQSGGEFANAIAVFDTTTRETIVLETRDED